MRERESEKRSDMFVAETNIRSSGAAAAAAAMGIPGGAASVGIPGGAASLTGVSREKTAEDELTTPIVLADRLKKAADESDDSFRAECSDLGARAELLSSALRSAVRRLSALPSSAAPAYLPPLRRIAASSTSALDRALSLARRCRRRRRGQSPLLRRLLLAFSSTGPSDFRRALSLLDASLADLRWLLALYSPDEGPAAAGGISLPPIATTDPILSYVWTCVAAAQMSPRPSDRADAAQSLANLALDSDRNKWVIVDEGGLHPLLALIRDGAGDADDVDEAAQVAAAAALANLAADRELVTRILDTLAVPVIIQVLSSPSSSMRLQTRLATLIARMAANNPIAQEEFARENAIRPLVSLLSFEVPIGDVNIVAQSKKKPTSVHSLVRINREFMGSSSSLSNQTSQLYLGNGGSNSNKDRLKRRENESPEVKLAVKVACAEALWMLSRGSIANSRKITETRGLLVLSKLIETEKEELQHNCLMTVMEITTAAETDADLRSSVFKKNSPAAKSVVEQLLRVIQQERCPPLQIAGIKSIGSLARTFPARESRILLPLVQQLWQWNPDVTTETAIALGKFVNPDNFLRVEHSKSIIEYEGIDPLMRLLRPGEKSQLPALVLLCYLAIHMPENEALERSNVLTTLESVSRSAVAQHHFLKELLPKAIYQLELYRSGAHTRIAIDTII